MAAPPAPPNFGGLGGTTVKIEHVERVLQKHFNTEHQIVAHEAKNIGDTKGFLSDILRIELTWSRQCQRLPKFIVAKIPCFHKIKATLEMMGGEDMKVMAKMMEKLDLVKKVRSALNFNSYERYIGVALRERHLRDVRRE